MSSTGTDMDKVHENSRAVAEIMAELKGHADVLASNPMYCDLIIRYVQLLQQKKNEKQS